MSTHTDEQTTVPVWHGPVRLSHWLLAGIVLFNLESARLASWLPGWCMA